MAEVRGALRARLWRGGRGAGRQRQRRQQQPQRAGAQHGAPRPLQPPGRRHCSTPSITHTNNPTLTTLAPNLGLTGAQRGTLIGEDDSPQLDISVRYRLVNIVANYRCTISVYATGLGYRSRKLSGLRAKWRTHDLEQIII